MAQNFHEFREQIYLRENIIVNIVNITAYSAIIFFDTFLIHEIKNAKILFRAFLQKFNPTKILYYMVYYCTLNETDHNLYSIKLSYAT